MKTIKNKIKTVLTSLIVLMVLSTNVPAQELKVEDVAIAMMLEFELELQKVDGLTYYTSNDMRRIIKSSRISENLYHDKQQF